MSLTYSSSSSSPWQYENGKGMDSGIRQADADE